MIALLGMPLGIVITIDILGISEWIQHTKKDLSTKVADLLLPATYLFLGSILVFSFNHAIVGLRDPQAFDSFFRDLDWSIFRVNVTDVSHWCISHFPPVIFSVLDFVYMGLFSRLAAALILAALLRGRGAAINMVRTMMICYAIGLLWFFLLPAAGPYTNCVLHMSSYPHSLQSFWSEEMLARRALMLHAHGAEAQSSMVEIRDYFISFPSMHIALPLIAIWSLRGLKRVRRVYFAIYALLLMPSVLLLEWHYLIDVVGGCAAALGAIWIGEFIERRMSHRGNALSAP